MRSVVFSDSVLHRINQYATHYRVYFEETYTDTGIWSEAMIIARYHEISLERKQSLRDSIVSRLSTDVVIGNAGNNTVTIPWRQRNLHISWDDIDAHTRAIMHLDIR